MRFFLLIALLGIAAARCPTGSRQCFKAMINRMQQPNILNQMLNDDVYGNNVDIDDEEDMVQQMRLQQLLGDEQLQGGQCWGGVCPGDDVEDQDDLDYDTMTGNDLYTNQDLYNNQDLYDEDDVYTQGTTGQYYTQGNQQCVNAQQQCSQQQQQCAQAQQRCQVNPQQCGNAAIQCTVAQQQCNQAQQQCQIQNQQQNQAQTQCGQTQQQCANAQQKCANAQQKCANKKQQGGRGQQQCAQAQQQCANAQQKCTNNQQQCANEQRQVGQNQNCVNKQQQCASQQQRCSNAQQQCANNKQQGNPNPQQCSHAQLKCHQAQQKCNQAQQQCPSQGDQTQQQCGQAQQQCAKAQQKCNNAENQCQNGQNDQQCAQAQKQCAQHQQQCSQQQQQCQQNNNENQLGGIFGGLFGPQNQQCQPNYNLLQQLEQPNCQIAAKLYKQAKQQCDDKNTVVSPAAVQVALAALQKGAQGTTKAQIKRVQCNGMSTQQCQQAHAALIRSLKGTNNVQQTQKSGQPNQGNQRAKINCPTTIVVNQQTPAKQQFKQAVQNCLGGQVKQCPFKNAPQQCRQQINQLMAAKTNHKLQQIVPKDAVTDNTKMIAVNALQLQAKWGQQFAQNQITKIAPFFPLGNQQPKQCQAIQSQGLFNYHENDQVQVVGIPTQQQELTLYVIVPKDQDGLTQVEKQQVQNGQQLKELLDNCDQQKQQVRVQLPKFQAKHKLDAKKTLQQQGVQDAFDNDQADFSNVNNQQLQQQQPGKQIHLNKIIHQCTIKITEQGITSANNQGENVEDIQEQFVQQMQMQQQLGDDEFDQEGQYGQQCNEYGQCNNQYGQQCNQYGQCNNQLGQQCTQGGQCNVKANRAFAFAVKHNPSNQIVMVGRVVDGCQKPHQQNQQTLDGVDQE